jgi:sulfate adenylyltransferase subunit 1
LVDASKLAWQDPAPLQLLPQTRRHALLVNLLRVPHIIFAVNKLDALDLDAPSDAHNPSPTHATGNAALAFARISQALETFAHAAGIPIHATIPMSALKGYNVVQATPGWCGYAGPSLLRLLERLPSSASDTGLPFAFPVQWVEKFHASADTSQGRRTFWGRVACGNVQVGHSVRIFPSGQTATVAQVLDAVRSASSAVEAGHSAGLILDREVDVSRGDWLLAAPSEETPAPSSASSPASAPAPSPAPFEGQRNLRATVAWMDDEPLVPGRTYWALHGHRWIKAKVQRILNSLDINTLQASEAQQIPPNGIGHIELVLQEPIAALPYQRSRLLGSLILVDTASHKTSGALLLQ